MAAREVAWRRSAIESGDRTARKEKALAGALRLRSFFGEKDYSRAAIAAWLGRKPEATRVLRQAFRTLDSTRLACYT